MSYGSKIISHKIASLRENASRALAFGPAVAAALAKARAKAGREAGETLPDYELLHQVIGRALEDQAAQMAELHQAHHHWRAREQHDKAVLRAAAVALRDKLRDVRHLFDRVFGTRKSVARFPGRNDLQRLPMHSLENVAAGLLRILDDDAFGWSTSGYDIEAHYVRETLGQRLADYRAATAALAESRGQRAHAAAERERRVAECEEQAGGLTELLRGLCGSAGYESAALRLRPRLPKAPRRRRADRNPSPPPENG